MCHFCSLSPQRSSVLDDDAAAADSQQQQTANSPLKARAGAATNRSNSFAGSVTAEPQWQSSRHSSIRELELLSPPSSQREQRFTSTVASSRGASTAGLLPGFSIVSQQQPQQQQRSGLLADLGMLVAADENHIASNPVGKSSSLRSTPRAVDPALPSSSRCSGPEAVHGLAPVAVRETVDRQASLLRRSSSNSSVVGSGSSSARGGLVRTGADEGEKPRRQVQKSVSFADLPSWPTSGSSVADDDSPANGGSAATVMHAHRRASDSNLAVHRHDHRSSNNNSNSRCTISVGLQSWRESVKLAQQQQEAAAAEHAAVSGDTADYGSRFTSLAAAAAEVGTEPAGAVQMHQSSAAIASQQHDDTFTSNLQQTPIGWMPQLPPVTEESPGSSPEKPIKPAAAAAAARSSAFSNAATAPAPAPADAADQEGVAGLRAALAAAHAELAAAQELITELARGNPDAAKLVEAGAKQEQALQEVGGHLAAAAVATVLTWASPQQALHQLC